MDRFVIACCIFSFITGMYVTHIVNDSKGCTVRFVQGNMTHIHIGHTSDAD